VTHREKGPRHSPNQARAYKKGDGRGMLGGSEIKKEMKGETTGRPLQGNDLQFRKTVAAKEKIETRNGGRTRFKGGNRCNLKVKAIRGGQGKAVKRGTAVMVTVSP